MSVIRTIVRKELLVNLLSLRFLVGLVIVLLMMGLVGYVLTEDYAARHQAYLADAQAHRQALEQTKVFSKVEVFVDIEPSPLSVFSRGIKDLPTAVRVSPYHIPSVIDEGSSSVFIGTSGSSDRRSNPLLRIFSSIDLAFVIGTIFSLFAVLLVFDSFSGEREQGTLKLMLSTSTGRAHLLVGKFLGALATLIVPLTLGFLEIVLLWSLSPKISLRASDWAGVALIYAVSIVFLSAVLALGLLISLFARESSSGLMIILLAWVIVVIVIPAGAEYLSDFGRPRAIRESVLSQIRDESRDFAKAVAEMPYQGVGGWYNADMTGFRGDSILGILQEDVLTRTAFNQKVFPLKFRFAEQRYRLVESYAAALEKWGAFRDDLSRPSLCVLFGNVAQAVAGTNMAGFASVVRRARFYRKALMAYLEPKVGTPAWFTRALEYPDVQPTNDHRKAWQDLIGREGERAVEKILSWDRIAALDLSAMPKPDVSLPGRAERLGGALADGLLLLGSVGIFLVLAMVRLRRYPVS